MHPSYRVFRLPPVTLKTKTSAWDEPLTLFLVPSSHASPRTRILPALAVLGTAWLQGHIYTFLNSQVAPRAFSQGRIEAWVCLKPWSPWWSAKLGANARGKSSLNPWPLRPHSFSPLPRSSCSSQQAWEPRASEVLLIHFPHIRPPQSLRPHPGPAQSACESQQDPCVTQASWDRWNLSGPTSAL